MKQTKEGLIKVRDVPVVLLELTGISRTRMTIYQWVKNGRRGYDNHLIHLKTIKRVGHLYTKREWVIDFLEKLG